MKKKIKDLTLGEINIICKKAKDKKRGCLDCPFTNISYWESEIDDYRTSFCPFDANGQLIDSLGDEEIEVGKDEEK